MRKTLNIMGSMQDALIQMGEGNPGGLIVLLQIAKHVQDGFTACILRLDDMNIRGSQIWVGYKDHCNEDLGLFIVSILRRDEEMITTINQVCEREGETAVLAGASSIDWGEIGDKNFKYRR